MSQFVLLPVTDDITSRKGATPTHRKDNTANNRQICGRKINSECQCFKIPIILLVSTYSMVKVMERLLQLASLQISSLHTFTFHFIS